MAGVLIKEMSEFVRAAGAFDRVGRKQLPFAISQAINAGLFDARKEIVNRTFPKSFDLHNKRFPTAAMRVDKASKGHLEGSLYDKLRRGHLAKHADGGTKRATSGNLAIPTRKIRASRGSRGIPKGKRPRAFKNAKTIRVTPEGIFRGQGGRLVPLYFFAPAANLPKRFPFYEVFEREVTQSMRANLPKFFRKALATAR